MSLAVLETPIQGGHHQVLVEEDKEKLVQQELQKARLPVHARDTFQLQYGCSQPP